MNPRRKEFGQFLMTAFQAIPWGEYLEAHEVNSLEDCEASAKLMAASCAVIAQELQDMADKVFYKNPTPEELHEVIKAKLVEEYGPAFNASSLVKMPSMPVDPRLCDCPTCVAIRKREET